MEETMEKEVLTTWSVQQFLRKLALHNLMLVGMLAVPLGLMLLLDYGVGIGGAFMVVEIIFGLIMLSLLADSADMIILSFGTPIMTKATRVQPPVGKKETFNRPRFGFRYGWGYIMYFHGHRRVYLPNYMYEDFDNGPLSDQQVWESTSPGDKFYLMKNHFGRVVYFFPCNDFEYVGELTPSKYEK